MRKTVGTPIPRGLKKHECQSTEGNYEWDNSCEGVCYRETIPKCSIGDSIAELDVGTLKVNVGRCDWKMQLIFRGNNYMPVSSIYLKGMRLFVMTKYMHTLKPNT
jgi:hypothetical protein